MDTPAPGKPMSEDRGRSIARPLLLAALALGGLAIATATLRDDTPRLTVESYESALARWEQKAITDYTLDVLKELDRQTPERLRTVVRDGQATSLTINDAEVPKNATYTVRGIFDIIERELEMADAEEKQPGQPGDAALRALFDAETGVPLVFKRLAGSGKSVILTVTRFEVGLPPATGPEDENGQRGKAERQRHSR